MFDRGYDDRKLIGFLVDNGVSFVIRGMGIISDFPYRQSVLTNDCRNYGDWDCLGTNH